jgi:hypothetical protein
MLDKISIFIFGIVTGASLGSILVLALCSRRPLCPRGIEHRLHEWNRRVERETAKRRGLLGKEHLGDEPPDGTA